MNVIKCGLIWLLILLSACCGKNNSKTTEDKNDRALSQQEINNESKIDMMEKFDIKKFQENQVEGSWKYIDQEGFERYQVEFSDGYQERCKKPGDLFEEYRSFDSDGDIRARGTVMINGGFVKGILYKFDKDGTIVEQKDYDTPFLFGWDSVYKFTQDYSIDLQDENTTISRDGRDLLNPYWVIVWEHETLPAANMITLSGLDGHIIVQKNDFGKDGLD